MPQINFSAIGANAAIYLKNDKFHWLNQEQKDYILSHPGDIRVQDPCMYEKPRIEIRHNQAVHQANIFSIK